MPTIFPLKETRKEYLQKIKFIIKENPARSTLLSPNRAHLRLNYVRDSSTDRLEEATHSADVEEYVKTFRSKVSVSLFKRIDQKEVRELTM